MKKFKKVLSVLLSVVMVLAMSLTSFAEGESTTFDITITGTASGHTYEAYQIFTGDLSGDGTALDPYVLSNITWGDGVNGTNLLTALRKVSDYSTCDDAADVAEVLSGKGSSVADEFAKIVKDYLISGKYTASTGNNQTYTISVTPGYYLVKDADGSIDSTAKDDAYSKFIVQVVGPVSVSPKSSVPSVEKKVRVASSSDAQYADVADYGSDNIMFKLVGTLPSTLADYDTYKYVFHDTLGNGFTYEPDSVVVYTNEISESKIVSNSSYSVAYANGGLTITFNNIKDVTTNVSDTIIVTYVAKLNGNAVLGGTGNTNSVYVEFSNDPNGVNEDSTGKTTTDDVKVFTYGLDVTKVAASDNNKKLSGAEFVLGYGSKYAVVDNGVVTEWVDNKDNATTLRTNDLGLINLSNLDEGSYTLEETKAPVGYNLLEQAIPFTISRTIDGTSLTGLTVTVNNDTTNGDLETGIVDITVVNNAGATLPSTGGIGTTIFYATGIILMAGAVFFVVRSKRHE